MTDNSRTVKPEVKCPSLRCPNMKGAYEGFDGERYRCQVCGESIWLDYEDIK